MAKRMPQQKTIDANIERAKTKTKIFELLGNKCSKCGFADFRCLQIDHVKGHGKKHGKYHARNLNYYRKILKEIQNGSKDWQLLCANCNWIKRWEENEGARVLDSNHSSS